MLSSRNINISPTKENQSPQGSVSNSPNKLQYINKILINLLNKNEISIPSDILNKKKVKSVANKQFKLRDIRTEQDLELKHLRIRLNDYQFQLKKTEEDFAQYKVVSKIQKQKIIKKLKDEIEALKRQLQDQNSNWQKRFAKRSQEFDLQITNYRQSFVKQYNQKIISITKQLNEKYTKDIDKLNVKNNLLRSELQKIQNKTNQEKKAFTKVVQMQRNELIQELKMKHIQNQKVFEEKMIQKIQYVQTQKAIQRKQHDQTKEEFQKHKKQYQNKIYYLNKDIDDLKYEIHVLEKKNIGLALNLKTKQVLIDEINKLNNIQKIKFQTTFQEKLSKQTEDFQLKIKEIKQKHIIDLNSYYNRINNLQQRKIQSQNILKQQIETLQAKFSQRPSKREDLDQISQLKCLLQRKQNQIEKCFNQLKYSQLQRQNMDKNYNKIFNAQSSRGRKSCSSTHREKDYFFKKNNPTDIKFLLKICNKDF